MFTCNMSEAQKKSIPLNGVDPVTASKLIDYAYTAEVTITQENVQVPFSSTPLTSRKIRAWVRYLGKVRHNCNLKYRTIKYCRNIEIFSQ